jgi:pimeloyl-ACP methyl ester carboxylesterase
MTAPPRDQVAAESVGAVFAERYVDADGFHIRYFEAGEGPPLVHFHGAGGPRLSRSHELLADEFRVIAFELPGFGTSPVNDRSGSIQELARSMAAAVARLGLEHYNLLGTSFGARLALWLAAQCREGLLALVLESPAAILPERYARVAISPEQRANLLYAHPERQPARRVDPEVFAKQEALLARLRGPNRDPDLEGRLASLMVPALVLFGTRDRVVPPEMGRVYRELLPKSQLVFVYDAGHAIQADRPEAFSSLVADFLERREQFILPRTSGLIHP